MSFSLALVSSLVISWRGLGQGGRCSPATSHLASFPNPRGDRICLEEWTVASRLEFQGLHDGGRPVTSSVAVSRQTLVPAASQRWLFPSSVLISAAQTSRLGSRSNVRTGEAKKLLVSAVSAIRVATRSESSQSAASGTASVRPPARSENRRNSSARAICTHATSLPLVTNGTIHE